MKPREISEVELTFPANVQHLMPPKADYLDYLDRYGSAENTWGFQLFSDLFHLGLNELELFPKEGINAELAFRHIRAIMRSFEPKHEHKVAACAYLFELWFDKAEWKTKSIIC